MNKVLMTTPKGLIHQDIINLIEWIGSTRFEFINFASEDGEQKRYGQIVGVMTRTGRSTQQQK